MLFGEKCKIRDAKLHGNVNSHNANPHCHLDFIWNHVGFKPPGEYLQRALTEEERLTLNVGGTSTNWGEGGFQTE